MLIRGGPGLLSLLTVRPLPCSPPWTLYPCGLLHGQGTMVPKKLTCLLPASFNSEFPQFLHLFPIASGSAQTPRPSSSPPVPTLPKLSPGSLARPHMGHGPHLRHPGPAPPHSASSALAGIDLSVVPNHASTSISHTPQCPEFLKTDTGAPECSSCPAHGSTTCKVASFVPKAAIFPRLLIDRPGLCASSRM